MKNFILISLLTIGFYSCNESVPEPDNTPDLSPLSSAEMKLSSSGNEFAFNLFRKIQTSEPTNTFVSPLSVGYALGMTLNGATDETRQSILNVMDFGDLTASEVNTAYRDLTSRLLSMDNKTKLGIANSIWSDKNYEISTEFSDIITNDYGGTARSLDFRKPETPNTINQWVEDKTNGKIKNLIDKIPDGEILFLINAVYFKSNWTNKFNETKTHSALFTKEDGTTTDVDMMFSDGVALLHSDTSTGTLIDIPYGNGQFSMTIIMPDQGIDEFVKTLSVSALNEWLDQTDSLTCELEIPKFKMSRKCDLKPPLKQMGMRMIDFPNFFKEELTGLEVTSVIHQSFIEVNEAGTEAAAATAVGVGTTSVGGSKPRITINRPFIFLIREKHTGTILFIGQLVDPDLLE